MSRRIERASLNYVSSGSDQESLAGVFAVCEVTVAAVFLSGGVRGQRLCHIVALGRGSNSSSAISRTFRVIYRISSIQRRPKRFRLREQPLQFGSVFSGSCGAIRIQILFQAAECCADILHYFVVWP